MPLLPPVIADTLPCNPDIFLFLPDSGASVPMDTWDLCATGHRFPIDALLATLLVPAIQVAHLSALGLFQTEVETAALRHR
jgi:hypothetical protein